MEANMFNNLSDTQIEEALVTYKNLPSVVTLLNGIKVAREASRKVAMDALTAQAEVEKAKIARELALAKLGKGLEKLWTPELTNVIFMLEEVNDTEHGEEVEIASINPVTGKPNLDKDGKAIVTKEIRYPKIKVITAKTNVFWSTTKAVPATSTSTTPAKRAIVVFKRDGTNLKAIGNFRSGKEACDHLHITVGTDSANRALQRDGYISEPYTGTDFTVAN